MRINKQHIVFTEDRTADTVEYGAGITIEYRSVVPLEQAGVLQPDEVRETLTRRLQSTIYGDIRSTIMRARMNALALIPSIQRSMFPGEFGVLMAAFEEALDACAFIDEPLTGLQKTAGLNLKETDR